ncbi:MAG TPA: type IX secretion system membrane protein PorP/SprF [Cryomorphaceae bacterium]|nr:type IX secretion system membrane protein PorP/SprF [Cryomorphaceae bacterium]
MKRSLLISFILAINVLFLSDATGQDQQYTQFYATPMYLNPAFAGTSIQSRVSTAYRNQWPALPRAFVSYNFAYDHFIPEVNSGIGIVVQHDKAGAGGMSFTSAAIQYAYEIKINRKFSIRPALSFGFGSTYLDVDKLTFMDQLARGEDGVSTLDPDRARFAEKPVNYPDFGAGLLLFSDQIWFGASLHHMNQPVHSIIGSDTRLPMKMGVHGGIRLKVSDVGAFSKRQYIVPAFNYQSQALFDQLDIGFYYEYDPIVLGLWYRGLPVMKNNGYNSINQDAVAVLVGYEINNMRIGYSYDLTISNLTPNSGGAHEITWTIEWASKKNKKKNKRRIMPCAKF